MRLVDVGHEVASRGAGGPSPPASRGSRSPPGCDPAAIDLAAEERQLRRAELLALRTAVRMAAITIFGEWSIASSSGTSASALRPTVAERHEERGGDGAVRVVRVEDGPTCRRWFRGAGTSTLEIARSRSMARSACRRASAPAMPAGGRRLVSSGGRQRESRAGGRDRVRSADCADSTPLAGTRCCSSAHPREPPAPPSAAGPARRARRRRRRRPPAAPRVRASARLGGRRRGAGANQRRRGGAESRCGATGPPTR